MARLVQDREDPQDPRRRTVVLVEAPTSPSLRIRQIATEGGFRVVTASSGPMLQSYARRNAPDLILLAPETGPPGPAEIARSIKEDAATREIPVFQFSPSNRFGTEYHRHAYPTEALLADDAPADEILRTMRMLTTRSPRIRYERKTASSLEGDLESDTFPEVLQFLFATAKTGCITLNGGSREGMICLESGRVVHAELGELQGLAAFRRMCFSQQGWFRFDPGTPAPRRTMRADGIALLLESARQKDLMDRDKTPFPVKKPRAPSAELFIVARSDDDESRASQLGPAGIALLIGLILLLAYGLIP
jgi:CheY-like chemotaxis protein